MADIHLDANLHLDGGQLRGLAAPVLASDAATKAYVDAAGGGGGTVILDFNGPVGTPSPFILDLNGA